MIAKMEKEEMRFIKYPKIPYIKESPELFGRDVYVFEKVDGSISQVRRTDQGLIGGSKANFISGSTKRPQWSPNFLKWMHSNHSLYNLKPGMVLFGEWLDPVTLDYEKEFYNQFFFIDLALIGENNNLQFFDYNEALDYLNKWKIENVNTLPIIAKKYIDESSALEIVTNLPSYLRKMKTDEERKLVDCEMEGIVLKNYNMQRFAKFLHPKYDEIRRQEQTIESQYLTENRVSKAIRRLKDSGTQNPSLEDVVNEVIFDIKTETDIDFEPDAVRGVIRVRQLYTQKNN